MLKLTMKLNYPIIICLLFTLSKQECMLYQAEETSQARAAQDDEKVPKLYKESMDVCQDFVGEEVCCTEAARNLMAVQFVKLEMSTDCQTCINNLKRLL